MSQVRPTDADLRLHMDSGVLTASWIPPSEDAYALIVKVRFVESGRQWSSQPQYRQQTQRVSVTIDLTSLRGVEVDSWVKITAHLCRLLPGNPKGWKLTKKAAVKADVGSSVDNKDLENLFHRQLGLSSQSGSHLLPLLGAKLTAPSCSFQWQAPDVSVKFLSAVQAVICWKNVGDNDTPDQWKITLALSAADTVHFYTIDGRTSKQKLPVPLVPRTKYTVTVTPLFKSSSYIPNGESTTTFTTPAAELTLSDLCTLHRAAINYCSRSGSAECNWLYRNKSVEYFRNIMDNCGGVMEVYKKDNSGDPASPINGKIDGLFFMAKNKNGVPPRYSYFGRKRLQVPANVLLVMAPNLYFADFYCMQGSIHQVTLVMTKRGSKSDDFCHAKLLPMSLTDRQNNPFLFRSGEQLFTTSNKKLEVELLFTEDINVGHLLQHCDASFSRTKIQGRGHSRPRGIPKNPKCRICNVPPTVQD